MFDIGVQIIEKLHFFFSYLLATTGIALSITVSPCQALVSFPTDFKRKRDRGLRDSGAFYARRVCQTDQQYGKERQEFPGYGLWPGFWTFHLPPLWLPGSCRRPARCVCDKGHYSVIIGLGFLFFFIIIVNFQAG